MAPEFLNKIFKRLGQLFPSCQASSLTCNDVGFFSRFYESSATRKETSCDSHCVQGNVFNHVRVNG